MKKVFSNSEIMHVFAQRTQSEARTTTNNVFFYGNKIYSYGYHYLLGEFLDDNTILINDKGYSVSTAKHISYLRQAVSQYKRFYTTETDEKYLITKLNSELEKLSKARKPEIYINSINYLFKKYCEFQEFKKLPINKEINKIQKTANNGVNLEAYKKLIQQKEAKEKREKLKKFKAVFNDFKNYETDRIYKGLTGFDYLRISKCRQFIETSQEIKIDIEDAQRIAKAIKLGLDIVGQKLKYYTINKFDKNGLVAGCHNIPKTEIDYILNLI
jgi:phosphoenolpyruvate synthase/pyruvate phosphate dikinase